MPFILIGVILLSSLLNLWLPLPLKSFIYALSLSIKSVIIFTLPFLIFGLLFKTAVSLSKNASKTILFLIGGICLSNMLCTLLSYGVGSFAFHLDLAMQLPQEGSTLAPLWQFNFPKWIGNGTAMFTGLGTGILLAWMKPQLATQLSLKIEKAIHTLLRGLLLLIPLFIAGFVIKMNHDKIMLTILRNYALIFALVAGAVFTYIALIYFIVNKCKWKPFVTSLKNMIPAAIAGFGSMSSAAAMPLTLIATEKNSQNPDLAKAIVPATVNIHLIGDCFAIPIFAYAILHSFGIAEPTFSTYLLFALSFVMAKFSVAAVPGGGILVMLPILESTLGLNAEMLSLITALYFLFDPVITCANVLGNGGFAIGMSRWLKSKESLSIEN